MEGMDPTVQILAQPIHRRGSSRRSDIQVAGGFVHSYLENGLAEAVGEWGLPRTKLWVWKILWRAFFTGECAAKMKVANEPCCRCKETEETILLLFYDCRDSKVRWGQLQEKARAIQASFQITHGLLETVDKAISTKKKGGPLIYILYAIINSNWQDRNQANFRNKPQSTPLHISLEQARVEIEGSFNKTSPNACWQQGLKALCEIIELLANLTSPVMLMTRRNSEAREEAQI
ncbi:hypothetical protein R1flu_024818 [Riccia fluitans]|uniref:Reverse transcriptase zinc-binding domain-containing protein n=1 Tax=Riccia fluitans TaxID=41844 RepID=A0ABD1XYZ5_9MARC